ncbi:hypothetical protein [Pseudomonas sp. W15Feb9B]|uniref:hypothetical protein n=1 Tax=Pseudomonas sp. W15Feb9B TaxID=550743 RepID=UPI000597E3FF|nr:hypothetical protein [Pseudomonas sp. W15Feb9B]KIK90031.1 hypothetical protein OC71_00155 [Pseudomonas sp. W15Feb9B]
MATHGLFFDAEIITADKEKIIRPFPSHDTGSLERELRKFYGWAERITVTYKGQFPVCVDVDQVKGMFFLAAVGSESFYYLAGDPGYDYLVLVFNNQVAKEQQSIL